jgi:hypothetical protein
VDLAWYLEFGQPTDKIFANIICLQPLKGHGHGQKADAGQLHRLAQAISAGLEG